MLNLIFNAAALIPQSRSVYRTIELVDGWDGRIIQTELYFNVMDGAMIVISMYCLNVLHPGRLLGFGDAPTVETVRLDPGRNSHEKLKDACELGYSGCARNISLTNVLKFKVWL